MMPPSPISRSSSVNRHHEPTIAPISEPLDGPRARPGIPVSPDVPPQPIEESQLQLAERALHHTLLVLDSGMRVRQHHITELLLVPVLSEPDLQISHGQVPPLKLAMLIMLI